MEWVHAVDVLTSELGANEDEVIESFIRGVVSRTQPGSVIQHFEAAQPEQLREIPFPILKKAILFSLIFEHIKKLTNFDELLGDALSPVVEKLAQVLSRLEGLVDKNGVEQCLINIEEDFREVVASALAAGLFSKPELKLATTQ